MLEHVHVCTNACIHIFVCVSVCAINVPRKKEKKEKKKKQKMMFHLAQRLVAATCSSTV
jgi:hypothetical protein